MRCKPIKFRSLHPSPPVTRPRFASRTSALPHMAFIAPTLPLRPSISRLLPNSTSSTPFKLSHGPVATTSPPRVIPSPLPNLFIYDHCPFCVRVRFALGRKNVKHNLVWLANDDAETPTALVGKKVVPIFQPQGPQGPAQKESLDIIASVDADPRFGSPGLLSSSTGRRDIEQWFDSVAWPMRRLTRVRFWRAPLPEFAFQEGRDAYLRNHALKEPPTDYEENFERSREYIAQIQERLDELADMVWSKECCSEGGLSYDDVDLFPRVRSMTIIKGLKLPHKLRAYVEYQAGMAEVPLYDYCAM